MKNPDAELMLLTGLARQARDLKHKRHMAQLAAEVNVFILAKSVAGYDLMKAHHRRNRTTRWWLAVAVVVNILSAAWNLAGHTIFT